MRIETKPAASAEETAAIVAALEIVMAEQVESEEASEPPRWRFSGRSWAKPVPLRRERPWT